VSAVPLALALAMAAPAVAEDSHPPGDDPVAQAAFEEPPARSEPVLPDLRGWRRDVALGLHSTTFWSHAGNHYTFHSLGLGVLSSWGRRGLFVHATALLPLQGRENGHVYPINAYYRRHYGGDFLLGYQARFWATRSLEAEAGGGAHAMFLSLKGDSGYRDFSASPLGIGGTGTLRWRTRRSVGAWPFTLALVGGAALDLTDPLHGHDLRHGFTFQLGFVAGLLPTGVR
jgi:hypothetical protein